jgi:hypothetical protein
MIDNKTSSEPPQLERAPLEYATRQMDSHILGAGRRSIRIGIACICATFLLIMALAVVYDLNSYAYRFLGFVVVLSAQGAAGLFAIYGFHSGCLSLRNSPKISPGICGILLNGLTLAIVLLLVLAISRLP